MKRVMFNQEPDRMKKRKYLTQDEINRLLQATRHGKYGIRDECLFQMCFIHGFRISEICRLTLSDLNLNDAIIHVRRLKNGLTTTHPLLPIEIRLLENWLTQRQGWSNADSPWIFLSQKGGPLSRQQAYNLLRRYGRQAAIPLSLYPHMLRHACGYALANIGADTRLIQDYLGHRNIQHTVLYTASNAERFQGLWQGKIKENKSK